MKYASKFVCERCREARFPTAAEAEEHERACRGRRRRAVCEVIEIDDSDDGGSYCGDVGVGPKSNGSAAEGSAEGASRGEGDGGELRQGEANAPLAANANNHRSSEVQSCANDDCSAAPREESPPRGCGPARSVEPATPTRASEEELAARRPAGASAIARASLHVTAPRVGLEAGADGDGDGDAHADSPCRVDEGTAPRRARDSAEPENEMGPGAVAKAPLRAKTKKPKKARDPRRLCRQEGCAKLRIHGCDGYCTAHKRVADGLPPRGRGRPPKDRGEEERRQSGDEAGPMGSSAIARAPLQVAAGKGDGGPCEGDSALQYTAPARRSAMGKEEEEVARAPARSDRPPLAAGKLPPEPSKKPRKLCRHEGCAKVRIHGCDGYCTSHKRVADGLPPRGRGRPPTHGLYAKKNKAAAAANDARAASPGESSARNGEEGSDKRQMEASQEDVLPRKLKRARQLDGALLDGSMKGGCLGGKGRERRFDESCKSAREAVGPKRNVACVDLDNSKATVQCLGRGSNEHSDSRDEGDATKGNGSAVRSGLGCERDDAKEEQSTLKVQRSTAPPASSISREASAFVQRRRQRQRRPFGKLEEGERIVWATESGGGVGDDRDRAPHQAIVLHPQPPAPQPVADSCEEMIYVEWLSTNEIACIPKSNIKSEISAKSDGCIEGEGDGDGERGHPRRERKATNRLIDTMEIADSSQLACEREQRAQNDKDSNTLPQGRGREQSNGDSRGGCGGEPSTKHSRGAAPMSSNVDGALFSSPASVGSEPSSASSIGEDDNAALPLIDATTTSNDNPVPTAAVKSEHFSTEDTSTEDDCVEEPRSTDKAREDKLVTVISRRYFKMLKRIDPVPSAVFASIVEGTKRDMKMTDIALSLDEIRSRVTRRSSTKTPSGKESVAAVAEEEVNDSSSNNCYEHQENEDHGSVGHSTLDYVTNNKSSSFGGRSEGEESDADRGDGTLEHTLSEDDGAFDAATAGSSRSDSTPEPTGIDPNKETWSPNNAREGKLVAEIFRRCSEMKKHLDHIPSAVFATIIDGTKRDMNMTDNPLSLDEIRNMKKPPQSKLAAEADEQLAGKHPSIDAVEANLDCDVECDNGDDWQGTEPFVSPIPADVSWESQAKLLPSPKEPLKVTYPVGCPVSFNFRRSLPCSQHKKGSSGTVSSISLDSDKRSVIYEVTCGSSEDRVLLTEEELAFAVLCPVLVRMDDADGAESELQGKVLSAKPVAPSAGRRPGFSYTILITDSDGSWTEMEDVGSDRVRYQFLLSALQSRIRKVKNRAVAIRSNKAGEPMLNTSSPIVTANDYCTANNESESSSDDEDSGDEGSSVGEDSVDPRTLARGGKEEPKKKARDPARERGLVAEIVRRYSEAREKHGRLPKGMLDRIVCETRRDLGMEENELSMDRIKKRVEKLFYRKPRKRKERASNSGGAGDAVVDNDVASESDNDEPPTKRKAAEEAAAPSSTASAPATHIFIP